MCRVRIPTLVHCFPGDFFHAIVGPEKKGFFCTVCGIEPGKAGRNN